MSNLPDPFSRYGLSRLINASGTETVFGASPVSDEVVAAIAALLPHSVDMAELQAAASRVIARGHRGRGGLRHQLHLGRHRHRRGRLHDRPRPRPHRAASRYAGACATRW